MIDLIDSGQAVTIAHAAQALGLSCGELVRKVDAGLVRKHPLPGGCRCVKLDEVKEDLGLAGPKTDKPKPRDYWSMLSRHRVESREPPTTGDQHPATWMGRVLQAHRRRDEQGVVEAGERLRLMGWSLAKIEPVERPRHGWEPNDPIRVWRQTWGDEALVLCDAMEGARRQGNSDRLAACAWIWSGSDGDWNGSRSIPPRSRSRT